MYDTSWHPPDREWRTVEHPFWMDKDMPASTVQYAPETPRRTLTETTQDGRRWYVDEENATVRYPSITTVLRATDEEGRKALLRWRKNVGEAAAQKISESSAAHGTKWHNFCEAFLTNQPYSVSPVDLPTATALAQLLNQRIRTVILSESRIASTRWGVAGRIDVCAELTDGRIAVIDFKTGQKPKSGNRLTNYALQATFYADALTECLQRPPITDLVVVQICPQLLLWQESQTSFWEETLSARIAAFHAQLS